MPAGPAVAGARARDAGTASACILARTWRRAFPGANKTADEHVAALSAVIARERQAARDAARYFRWLETSFVISNIETLPLPPNTAFNFSSALIRRRLTASCSLFFLM